MSSQKRNFEKNKELVKDLKLILIKKSGSSIGCRLRGLDGGVKNQIPQAYTLKKLEGLINAMPMRQQELIQKK
jgi:hypothetical protein